jgi:general secretion pathway protein K
MKRASCASLTSPLNNSKGVALLQTLFLVMLIIFIVNQVNFETAVEYTMNAQSLHRIKAYQAAKSGVEISLLRISIYNKVSAQLAKSMGSGASGSMNQMLNMIYSFPLTWPMVLPGDKASVENETLNDITKKSLMDATFATQIQSEDLLNINDLDSPLEGQRERVRNALLQLFRGKMELDREWVDRNREFPFEDIINNIKDWIDPDTQGSNGSNESRYYAKLRELDRDNQNPYPPNRHFRTIDEIRMVPGVNDEIFQLIKPAFSVFGPMGINPNLADAGALKSLHKSLTDEIVQKIISRRERMYEGGPYKDADDFFNYVSRQGGRISQDEQSKIPLRFESPCNFRIQSSGSSGKTVITITAITYDVACSQKELSTGMSKANQQQGQTQPQQGQQQQSQQTQAGQPQQNQQGQNQTPQKGPPRIVYWNEQ